MIPVAITSGKGPSEGFLVRPSAIEPHGYVDWFNSNLISPVCEGHGAPVVGEVDCFSCVPGLLVGVSPAAVVRRVVTVDVDPVDGGAAVRSWPHVGIENCEVGIPLIANRYAATTVVFVLLILGIITSRLHVAPVIVLWRKSKAVCGSILSCLFAVHNEIVPQGAA